MGNLLKEMVCVIGILYLIMHVAHMLTSTANSIKCRRRWSKEAMPSGPQTLTRGKAASMAAARHAPPSPPTSHTYDTRHLRYDPNKA